MTNVLVVDSGYSKIKSINDKQNVDLLHNSYVVSSEKDASIPLDAYNRKVSLYDENTKLTSIRTYGSIVCETNNHIQGLNSRKTEEMRFTVAAMLRPEYNNKEIHLICIYNDPSEFSMLEKTLLGRYKVKINGVSIDCQVISVKCLHEGLGTYFYLQKNLHSDKANLEKVKIYDLGFGVANCCVVNNGVIEYYANVPELSVYNLASILEKSPLFQESITHFANGRSNYTSIAYALEKDLTLGSIPREQWNNLKKVALQGYFKNLRSHLRAPINNGNIFVNSYVLTGGGAALLKRESSILDSLFIIPNEAQLASLKGIFYHPYVQELIHGK